MKVTIYIAKNDFDAFFRWVKQLELGILSTPPITFSHNHYDIKDPLKVSLGTDVYYLITDAQEDLKNIDTSVGPFSIDYESDTEEAHLQRIKESLRKAKREDLEIELVYSALAVMKDIPNITPSEAIILAERTLLGTS
jgi:hypothetical protein